MPLDWSRVGAGNNKPLLRPRDVYAALPNRPWSYLRHEQGEVLDKWFERRDDRDIVIKQNTGGGKTVDALLIAQSTLNEGLGPAVYLAPDTYLAKQVRAEAERLGIATTDDAEDFKFRQGKAILVATFQKLVNGKSVFGVVGDDREKMRLGIVVVDDAHAALATAEGQFRLAIPSSHPAYEKLLDLFATDLEDQSPRAWADVRAQDYTAVVRIPFWSWEDRRDEVLAILHPHAKDDDFKFVWPLIGDLLPLCSATVTSRSIELRPACLPISMIPAFAKATRRVYLTATLADDSVLVTVLDADPAMVTRPVTPGSAADLGDRMILAPIALNRELSDMAVRVMARQFADGDRDGDGIAESTPLNVVVLVPSKRAAQAWSDFADRTLYVTDLQEGVAELKAGHVGLVVMVNKYDGVDLPHDACRLLIIDDVPRPMDATERREAGVLSDSPTFLSRQIQRVEQGMGRGVRDSEDYCVVLLMGSKLAEVLHNPRHQALLSPATRAQVQLSWDIATQVQGEGLGAIREVIRACLEREPEWVAHSRRALAGITYEQSSIVRPEAIASRRAFDLASTARFREAADCMQRSITEVADPALRGLLMEQRASYLHRVDPLAAQKMLGNALDLNPFVLRPTAGIAPGQLRAASAQAPASATFLSSEYQDGVELVLGIRALLDDLVWGEPEQAAAAEAAWHRLGLHLGLASTRPDKLYGSGPDVLWALSMDRHAVIELKTGSTTDTISKGDLDQLGGSERWDQATQGDVRSLPVLVHPSAKIDSRGTAVPEMRVVTPDKWDAIKGALIAFAVALADGRERWRDDQAVAEQLTYHKLTAGNFFQTFAVAPV